MRNSIPSCSPLRSLYSFPYATRCKGVNTSLEVAVALYKPGVSSLFSHQVIAFITKELSNRANEAKKDKLKTMQSTCFIILNQFMCLSVHLLLACYDQDNVQCTEKSVPIKIKTMSTIPFSFMGPCPAVRSKEDALSIILITCVCR